MSLYADQHAKKREQAQRVSVAAEEAPHASGKENTRFRRSSRPTLPIGSASKQSSGSVAGDSPAPRAPLNTCPPSSSAAGPARDAPPASQSRAKSKSGALAGTPISASHTPSTIQPIQSAASSPATAGGTTTEQEAVAALLTRASEALKAERLRSSQLSAETSELHQGLQRMCDLYMALEGVLTSVERAKDGSPGLADSALLGLQARELADKYGLRLPAQQRNSLAVLTPREEAPQPYTQAPQRSACAHGLSRASSSSRARTPRQDASRPQTQAHLGVPALETTSLPRARSASATVLERERHADAYDGTLAVVSTGRREAAQQAMVNRLRRALAPQPTRQQVGDVIDAMVDAIQQDPAQVVPAAAVPGGPRFRLTKVSPCTFRLAVGSAAALHAHAQARARARSSSASGRRVDSARDVGVHESLVHLAIHSGSLCVQRGGGPVDFFDYMDRKLRLMKSSR